MRRYNDGMIITNDRCVACNHCVHVCPAVGANVSANQDGRISIDVSDKNCIHCGSCINECVHGARQYTDSLDELLLDLKRGNEVSLITDPTFVLAYGEEKAASVFGYLKTLGIKAVYDGSIGGDISIFCHAKYIHDNMDDYGKCDKFFAHTCPAFSNFVSRYAPNALDRFIPVQLPAVCAAIYYRKYKGIKGRFALLSPCTAIYDEFSSFNTGRNINYLIGYKTLFEYIGDTDISGYNAGFDMQVDGIGAVLCENSNFSTVLSRFFPSRFLFKSSRGLNEKYEMIAGVYDDMENDYHPTMVTVDLCRGGCLGGPAVDLPAADIHRGIIEYEKKFEKLMETDGQGDLSPNEKYDRLAEKFSFVNTMDFEWEGEEDYHQKCSVPENVVEEIFESMHKTTKVKKELNCQACGYKSCYEMVCAVANGYSRIEDCVHYLNDELKVQLGVDSLTGLYNQRGFLKAANRYIVDNPDKKFILATGDINGLGGINDLYSNTGGDHVIQYIAKVIEEFSDKRGLCARLGAGTFGCLFENTPENLARFKEDTQVSVAHLNIDYPLSLKFGMYEINEMSTNVGRAMLYATYACRTSKDRSRNTYVLYTEEMSRNMSLEAEITQKMKSSMEKGEFVLYFQPKYDHTTGELRGAEALSRWIKPDGEMISPGVFIPVFEKNGYITELDRYVWRSSFEKVSKWVCAVGKAVPVSVNISRISLMDEGIITYISDLKNNCPAAAEYIQFEITESAYAGNISEIFSRVRAIRDMGFKVNMDDFGSGYSSLNLLKNAPIDIVKLDMGFLRGEDNLGRGDVIISAVVNMTKDLGFDIIAEGVETKEQADMLAGMGCNMIQGYYYSRPVPEEDFVKLL